MSFFYEILNDGTPYRRKKLRVKRLILTIAAALFILITLLCSFAIIPSGYTGVRTTFGQIDTVAVSNGFIAKIPYVQSIKRVNNKQQEVSYADQIWGESSERTVVYAAGVTVTYRINPDYSAWIYANVSDYKQNALPQTLLSSAIKAAMVSLPSDEVTNRAKIEPIARQQLQTAIDQKYGGNPVISIVAVNIDDMDFEESYNQAIAEKQIAQMVFEKQQIQNETAVSAAEAKAKEQLIAAEADAKQKLVASKAEADSVRSLAEAQAEANRKLAQSVTDILIEYEKIEKWDGRLPTVSGSGALVCMDGITGE